MIVINKIMILINKNDFHDNKNYENIYMYMQRIMLKEFDHDSNIEAYFCMINL